MKLYYHPARPPAGSSCCSPPRRTSPLEYQVVDLFTGEHMKPPYAAINPSCLVPMLEDGDFRLTESSAILKYLAERPARPPIRRTLRARAKVNEMMDWFNTSSTATSPTGSSTRRCSRRTSAAATRRRRRRSSGARSKRRCWLKVLDENIIGPKKAYLCGDAITDRRLLRRGDRGGSAS